MSGKPRRVIIFTLTSKQQPGPGILHRMLGNPCGQETMMELYQRLDALFYKYNARKYQTVSTKRKLGILTTKYPEKLPIKKGWITLDNIQPVYIAKFSACSFEKCKSSFKQKYLAVARFRLWRGGSGNAPVALMPCRGGRFRIFLTARVPRRCGDRG